MIQFPRIDGVVLDRVPGPDHLGIFQARNRRHHRRLDIDRHAGGHAVHVDFVCIQTLRFQEDLVPRLVRKLDDLVFNGRAVARADAFDLTAIERGSSDAISQNLKGLL